MNNLLHSIRNWESKWIGLCAVLLVLLGNFINQWGYFICITSIVAVVSFIRYFHDRKWLKETQKYIRLSEKMPFWRRAIGFIWTVGAFIFIIYYDFTFEAYVQSKTMTAIIIVFVFLHFGDHFQKFVNSVKSFEEGIQLPGRNQEMIPWKEVYDFNFVEKEEITISSSKGEHQFIIDKEDPEHVNGMISDWRLRNGKRR